MILIPYSCVYLLGLKVEELTLHLSVFALTFTQLVLKQQDKENEEDKRVQQEQLRTEKKIEEEIKN